MRIQTVFGRTFITIVFLVFILCFEAMASGTLTYQYDDMNRLVKTVYDDGTAVIYTYDLMGNRFSRHIALVSSPANATPDTPSNPTPMDGSSTVDPLSATLQWSGGDPDTGDAVSYEIYFGTNSPPALFERTTASVLSLDALEPSQTYYWQVKARDSRCDTSEGPIWQFTTSNTPPNAPVYRMPANDAGIVAGNAYLSWDAATDPNAGDYIADYDIYLGTSPTPPLVSANHSGTVYSVGALSVNTTYYWKIIARDNHGATSTGSPVWSFTTFGHAGTVLTDQVYSQNTTLARASGPYTVQNTLTVDPGAILTIEPGTVFKFEAGATLVVNGALMAQGTSAMPIIFTSERDDRYAGDTNGDGNATEAAPGDWGGIQMPGGSVGRTIDLTYCRIFYASNGLSATDIGQSVDMVIDHSEFSDNSGNGIQLELSGNSTVSLSLDDSVLSDNGDDGLYANVTESGTEITGHISTCTVSGNGGHGLYMRNYDSGRSNLSIEGNTITDNNAYGIYAYAEDSYTNMEIDGNAISGCKRGIEIALDGWNQWLGSLTISKNEVSDCTDIGICCYAVDDSFNNCQPRIIDNYVHDNAGTGIRGYSVSDEEVFFMDVRGNTVTSNAGSGLYITRWDNDSRYEIEPHVMFNTVTNNGDYGVFVQATALSQMFFNDIHQNDGIGLYVEVDDNAAVHYNNIYASRGRYELFNASHFEVSAQHNYWGSNVLFQYPNYDSLEDNYSIYDYFDDAEKGRVYYSDWSQSKISLPEGPISKFLTPIEGTSFGSTQVQVKGIAVSPAGLGYVEVSDDGGASWQTMNGAGSWSGEIELASGAYTLLSRVTDANDVEETPGVGVNVTVDTGLPTTSGPLSEDETWTGTVTVAGDVIVPEGKTLTIADGTQIIFTVHQDTNISGASKSRAELIVYGSLIADGAVFGSSSTTPTAGDWYGIRVLAEENDVAASLSNCTVSHGQVGLSVVADNGHTATVTLTGTTVSNSAGDGIWVDVDNDATLDLSVNGCTLSNNGGNGLYVFTDNADDFLYDGAVNISIDTNTIDANGEYGVYLYVDESDSSLWIGANEVSGSLQDGIYYYMRNGTSGPRLVNNHVHDNGGHGIHGYTGASDSGLIMEVRGNTVVDNTGSGIYCDHVSESFLITLNTVTGNGAFGIYSQSNSTAEIYYNDIHENGDIGLYVEAEDGSSVHYNNFYGNLGDYELSNGNESAVDARHNYWGGDVTAEMTGGSNPKDITRIYDIYDESGIGRVYYEPWLDTVQTMPTGPVSHVIAPVDGSTIANPRVSVRGISVSAAAIDFVEVSDDGGANWQTMSGAETWSGEITLAGDGAHTLQSRATDVDEAMETPGAGVTVTVDTSAYTTSGALTEDETWSGTVQITGDVTVPAGITLTLELDTEVRFPVLNDDTYGGASASQSELIVYGNLIANGAVFSSSSATPTAGDWYGIRVLAEENDAAVNLSNSTISHGQTGLKVNVYGAHTAAVTLADTTIDDSADDGIWIKADHGATVLLSLDGTTLSDNGANGLYSYAYWDDSVISGHISWGTVSGNGANGLYVQNYGSGRSDLSIDSNVIEGNAEYGVYAYTRASNNYLTDIMISGNTISGGTNGIYLYSWGWDGSLTISNNDVNGAANEGIYAYALSGSMFEPRVIDNYVHDNGSHGIRGLSNASTSALVMEIHGNTVTNNAGSGIHCSPAYSSSLIESLITFNTLTSNGGYGVYIESSTKAAVYYNSIYDNLGDYELVNGSETPVDARYNYWGSGATTEMTGGGNPKDITRIFDSFDEPGLGRVYYEPWLDTVQVLPTGPVSFVIAPVDGSTFGNTQISVSGVAYAPAGVDAVEISVDGGGTWQPMSGAETWTGEITLAGDGVYTLESRATDAGAVVETPGTGVTVTVDTSLPTISGTLSGNETWSGIWTVTGDVTVPVGTTLIIEPGAQVNFAVNQDDTTSGASTSQAELIVYGTLIADGVVFDSSSITAARGDWYGIRVVAEANDATVSLSNCEVSNGQVGVSVSANNGHAASVTLTDTAIEYIADDGIWIDARGGATVALSLDGTELSYGGGNGLYAYVSDSGTELTGHISTSAVLGNEGHGLYVYNSNSSSSDLSIDGNTVANNAEYGIYASADASNIDMAIDGNTISGGTYGIRTSIWNWDGSLMINNNEVSGASEDGIYCRSVGNTVLVELQGNTVMDNGGYGIYWRNSDTDPLESPIALNTVTGNGDYGMYIESSAPVQLYYNDIHGNYLGILLEAGDGSVLNYNNLYGNLGAYDLNNENEFDVDGRYNYWGQDWVDVYRILDGYWSSSRGVVDYSDWLSDFMENEDSDADTLTNIWEYENGLNPQIEDSDADGLNDGDEKTYWGDSWNADIDSDGLINILDPDADGDGSSDGDEIAQGTDPGDAGSSPGVIPVPAANHYLLLIGMLMLIGLGKLALMRKNRMEGL